MRRIEDIKFSVPIIKHGLAGTKTGISASIDTLGAEDVLLSVVTGATAQAHKFYFYHASGSTTTSASATAFGTVPTLTTAATASQRHGVLIEGQVGRKRYLVVKLSNYGTTATVAVIAHQFANRTIPSTATLGSYTSIVRPLV